MRIGLLWFDDDPKRGLAEKIERAAARYREKMGLEPDTCCVHPSQVSGQHGQQVAGVRVITLPSVLPHHFWIGRDEAAPQDLARRHAGAALLREVEATAPPGPQEAQALLQQLDLGLGPDNPT